MIRTDTEFDRLIAAYCLRGYQVADRSQDYATLVVHQPVNHVLHLLLTLVTFGLWAPIWLLVAITRKDHRITLTRTSPANLWLTRREARMLGME
jgi:hypothetical protein